MDATTLRAHRSDGTTILFPMPQTVAPPQSRTSGAKTPRDHTAGISARCRRCGGALRRGTPRSVPKCGSRRSAPSRGQDRRVHRREAGWCRAAGDVPPRWGDHPQVLGHGARRRLTAHRAGPDARRRESSGHPAPRRVAVRRDISFDALRAVADVETPGTNRVRFDQAKEHSARELEQQGVIDGGTLERIACDLIVVALDDDIWHTILDGSLLRLMLVGGATEPLSRCSHRFPNDRYCLFVERSVRHEFRAIQNPPRDPTATRKSLEVQPPHRTHPSRGPEDRSPLNRETPHHRIC